MTDGCHELAHVTSQVPRQYLCVARRDGFQQGVMDEHVLVLRLNHVVALRPQARHVTIDIDRVHVLDPLQHRVDDDKGARPPHTRASQNKLPSGQRCGLLLQICT